MPSDTWNTIKSSLKDSLPNHAIITWFDPIKPVAISGEELVLEVPNQFFYEWIGSHYLPVLTSTISKVSNNSLKPKFIVSAEKKEVYEKNTSQLSSKKLFKESPNLNSGYTFETFIEGSNNQFAKTACQAVAELGKKKAFNPLIIYGGVGLGKTHLLHSIGNKISEENENAKIVVATSEKFTLDFVNGLRKNKTVEFANRYRSADVLLIDDIQFFRGKEQTQEQFFHTFNELHQSGKQIVMTADRFPGEMQGLQDRLLSRFQSGLSVDIQPPNFEMRVAILMDKAERNGVELPYDVIEFIATHMRSNIRDLEGTVIRLLARSSLMNQEIDNQLVRDVVKERMAGNLTADLSVEDVVRKVSETSTITVKEIVGKSRKMEIVEVRQMAMYLCRNILGTSLNNIGIYFGGRDHTTVMHAMKAMDSKQKTNPQLKQNISNLKQELSFDALA